MNIVIIKVYGKLHYKIFARIPFVKYLSEIILRFILAQCYDKNSYCYKENVFQHIYKNNTWNDDESRSGSGSRLSAVATIRKELPLIWKKYNIKTFLDIPCGDFNWMKEVDKKGIEYIGGDIVEEVVKKNNKLYATNRIKFLNIDITKDALPKVDMIFCKDCMQHLSYENVVKALKNFTQSGCKYLMLTSYPLTVKNHDILDGDCRMLNLLREPFNLPKNYLCKIKEKSKGKNVEIDKYMYLWDIADIERKNIKIRN